MKTLDQIYAICPQLSDPTLTSAQLNDLFMDSLDLDDEDYALVLASRQKKNTEAVPDLDIDTPPASQRPPPPEPEEPATQTQETKPPPQDTDASEPPPSEPPPSEPPPSEPPPSEPKEFDREKDPYYKNHLTPEEKKDYLKNANKENSKEDPNNYDFAPWYGDPKPSLGDEVGDPFLDWNDIDFEERSPDYRCQNPAKLPPDERNAEMYEKWAEEKAYRKRRLKYIEEWKAEWLLREQKRLDDRRLAAQDNLINVVSNYRAKMEESYDRILQRVDDAFKASADKQEHWIEQTNARTAKAINDLREQLASRTAQIINDLSEELTSFEQQQAGRIRAAAAVFTDQDQKTRELVIARINRMKAEFQQVRPDDITFEDVSFEPPRADGDFPEPALQQRKERRVVCAICRRPFYTSAGRSKYCSQACREKAAWGR